ncbi:hypothetical protein AB0C28_07035 [Nonomuraea sp. NPDC048892]|uniref:hypothetical protein n=1 Tax=Nonomuraea sp. NPDC048892 TaxID=3154624 RepID=UPI003405C821
MSTHDQTAQEAREICSAEGQYLCLVKVAWQLRALNLSVRLELLRATDPAVVISTARDTVKVTATLREGAWALAWGRGRRAWVAAEDSEAAVRIAEAVGL